MTNDTDGDQAGEGLPTGPFKPTEISNSTEDDVRMAFSGPAMASNRFFLSIVGSGVRIAFTEQHGAIVGPQFRSAVLLSIEDAFALRDLLSNQLSKIQFLEVPPQEQPSNVAPGK